MRALIYAALIICACGTGYGADRKHPETSSAPDTIRAECVRDVPFPKPRPDATAATAKGDTAAPPRKLELIVDGKAVNPCADPSVPVLVQSVLGTGVGYKLYSFANVGTEKDVELQLRKIGLSPARAEKAAPSMFRRLTSTAAKSVFFLFTLAEAGYAVYHLYDTYDSASKHRALRFERADEERVKPLSTPSGEKASPR
jgi:hypothetical protein